jgi:hypothetical protein
MVGSVVVGECPAEAGELAGDGHRDDRAALAALSVKSFPHAVQASLRLPRDLDDVSRLSVLAASQRLAFRRGAAVVPGGLDEQPARVRGDPVLVIAPCRRFSPLVSSDGVRPR